MAVAPRTRNQDRVRRSAASDRAFQPAIIVAVLAVLIVQAELVVTFVNVQVGVLAHALLVAGLLGSFGFVPRGPTRRALPALAMVPVLRILSLTMPIPAIPPIFWFGLVGPPLLVGILLAARAGHVRPRDLGLRPPSAPDIGWRVVLAGPPLGIIAGALSPPAVTAPQGANEIVLGLLLVFLFAGVTVELLFRGLLQNLLRPMYGRWAFVFANVLFVAVYLSTLSVALVLVMAAAGLLFGWSVAKTGSVWPAAVSHGLLAVVAVVVWATILG
jgi:uncharacterized protein